MPVIGTSMKTEACLRHGFTIKAMISLSWRFNYQPALTAGQLQEQPLVLSPGEIKGIPIELFANTDWDKSGFGMTISITHPLLGTTDWPIQIRHANVTFASSPVISGYQTSVKSIELHNPNSISASVEKGTLSGNSWMITLDNLRENISLTAGDDLLTLHADGRNIPAHSAQCTLLSPDTEKLGLEAISEKLGIMLH